MKEERIIRKKKELSEGRRRKPACVSSTSIFFPSDNRTCSKKNVLFLLQWRPLHLFGSSWLVPPHIYLSNWYQSDFMSRDPRNNSSSNNEKKKAKTVVFRIKPPYGRWFDYPFLNPSDPSGRGTPTGQERGWIPTKGECCWLCFMVKFVHFVVDLKWMELGLRCENKLQTGWTGKD